MPAYFDGRIELQAHPTPVYAYAGNQPIGHSDKALRLRERGYADRFYLPWHAIASDCLQRSDRQTHCPYKGETRYYHVVVDGVRYDNAGWVYPEPRAEMAAIAGHIAFDHPQITLADAPRV